MLILSRRIGEAIRINNEISVTLLGIKGNQVRLGVNAPIEIPIHREEVHIRIQDEENRFTNLLVADEDD